MKLNEILDHDRLYAWIMENVDPSKKQEYIADKMGEKILAAAREDSGARDVEHGEGDVKVKALEIVKKLTNADPSPGLDNLNWIVRMYVAKQFKLEDISKLKQELTVFMKAKPKLEKKDLGQYTSLNDLYDVTDKYADQDLKSKGEAQKEIKTAGVKKLIDTPNFKALIVKTKEAACFYGKGTKWCTAADQDNAFDHYHNQGPLIILICKDKAGKDRKFQLHYNTNQFMNERDQEVTKADISVLSAHPEYKEFLNKMIHHHYYGGAEEEEAKKKAAKKE